MTLLATSIYQRVLQAMQSAGELGGPEGEDYLALMSVIETEAHTRKAAYVPTSRNQPPHCRPKRSCTGPPHRRHTFTDHSHLT
jgi:hypothetical protein